MQLELLLLALWNQPPFRKKLLKKQVLVLPFGTVRGMLFFLQKFMGRMA